MKFILLTAVFALTSESAIVRPHPLGSLLREVKRDAGAGKEFGKGGGSDADNTVANNAISAVVRRMLEGGNHAGTVSYNSSSGRTGLGLNSLLSERVANLDLATALKVANMPTDVVQLVYAGAGNRDKDPNEAVNHLNGMIKEAWTRLDSKTIECSETITKTDEALKLLSWELSRLSQQVSNVARQITSANSQAVELSTNTQATKEELEKEKAIRAQIREADVAILKKREADLAIGEFMLEVTKCPDSFLQAKAMSFEFQVCVNGSDVPVVTFAEQDLNKYASSLTHEGHGLLAGYALAAARDLSPDVQDREDGDEPVLLSIEQAPVKAPPKKLPPMEPPVKAVPAGGETKAANKCSGSKPDCGVLHDLFANLWGDMRDLVSESTDKLHKEDEAHNVLVAGLSSQLQAQATQDGELQTLLAESTTSKTAFIEQQMQKQEESAGLQKLHTENQEECESIMKEILFTEICGTIKVRNEVIKKMLPSVELSKVVDCEVGEWTPGECSVPCDDNLVGGTMTMTRDTITKNETYASECPVLAMTKRCNQKKCAVDCQLGEWASYGTCTKECGGGVQSRNRPRLVQPKNQGQACDALQESRPCNTGRCDVDCELGDWTAFGECNQVCDNGLATKIKPLIAPAIRRGKCTNEFGPDRTSRKPCNPEVCTGDEICLAKMDLVVALDASGSIRQKGFDVLKEFAARVVRRMVPKAYGREAVRVGVVMFGNGKLDKNKIVSDAEVVMKPTDDMEAAAKSIMALKWQRGFTNMAQAFTKAKNMLSTNSRKTAEGTMMLITDGRPSFKFQTNAAVKALRKTVRLMVVHVKGFRKPAAIALLKGYASLPVETNYFNVPGKRALKASYETWVTKTLVRACPRAESPTAQVAKDNARGFQLVREDVTCGAKGVDAPQPKAIPGMPFVMPLADCGIFAASQKGWVQFSHSAATGVCTVYMAECDEKSISRGDANLYKPIAKAAK